MTETAIEPKRTQRRDRSAAEIARALTAVAYANGNTRRAEQALEEDGMRIDHSTLWDWQTNRYPQEYARIRAEILPKILEQAGDEHLDLARRQIQASAAATDAFMQKRHELDPKELSTAARNFSVGSGIHSQNANLFHDRPTERRAIDLPGTLKELRSMGVDPAAVIDAEVVSEEDA